MLPSAEGRAVTVGVVAPRGSQTLDVVGPIDAFAQASQVPNARVRYEISLLGTAPGPIIASSGIRLLPDRLISEACEPFDTLLVAGSPDYEAGRRNGALTAWLAEMASVTRRIGSVCNGAFILGERLRAETELDALVTVIDGRHNPLWLATGGETESAGGENVAREPQAVLKEFGLEIDPSKEIRTWDSSAQVRWFVVPERPPGTQGMSEEDLATLVTPEAMMGVAVALPKAA